jgi:hypothetical protein
MRWCRRRHRRKDQGLHQNQTHFGSLDDLTLSDLGLSRGELRAAEYGVVPPNQALHLPKDAPSASTTSRDENADDQARA